MQYPDPGLPSFLLQSSPQDETEVSAMRQYPDRTLPDGSYKAGIFKGRSKGKATYSVIQNRINGENNPRGKTFFDKQEAILFFYSNDEV